jgi:hypothetical protein
MEELAPSGEAKMHTPREALPGVDQQDQYDRQADERFHHPWSPTRRLTSKTPRRDGNSLPLAGADHVTMIAA